MGVFPFADLMSEGEETAALEYSLGLMAKRQYEKGHWDGVI